MWFKVTPVSAGELSKAADHWCKPCKFTLLSNSDHRVSDGPRVSDVTAKPHPNNDESVPKVLWPNFVAAIQVSNILQLRFLRLHFKGPKWLLIYSLWFPGAQHTLVTLCYVFHEPECHTSRIKRKMCFHVSSMWTLVASCRPATESCPLELQRLVDWSISQPKEFLKVGICCFSSSFMIVNEESLGFRGVGWTK